MAIRLSVITLKMEISFAGRFLLLFDPEVAMVSVNSFIPLEY